MADTSDAVFAFLVAAAIAWLLVPFTERLAWRIGAVDYPNERSLHDRPTPKLSGAAILVAVLVSGALFLPGDGESRAILGGAAVIALVGVVDDVFDLSAPVS
jgi:UDP-N-acetylmuramyl pentapeptide phosphotransferase/UDP-N-acetylglucosamine-1-phosphate transferase